jgi:Na+/proline symporter
MDLNLHIVSLPLWASGLLMVGGTTLVAVLGPLLVRRYVALERLSTNNEVAGFKFATLGVIYAVLLAFAVIAVWEKFSDAEGAVAQEAGALTALYRLSGSLDPDAQAGVRDALARYLHTTIAEDWPAMARGTASPGATRALTAVYGAVLAHDPSGPRGGALLGEMLGQLDQVTQARRRRLGLAAGIVPALIWLVLFTGAVVTIAFAFFFGTQNLRAQVLMSGMLALMISLSLFVVVSIDHPFTGPVRVLPEPLEAVVADFGENRAPPRPGAAAAR